MVGSMRMHFLQVFKQHFGVAIGGFFGLIVVLAIAEQYGMPGRFIGYAFLVATFCLYVVMGLLSRSSDVAEYYVAGQRAPALVNGMANAAEWLSVATFIGLAGGLYVEGYDGLAFVIGWSGGYVLVALLLAPSLRQFGQFTLADFFGERYGLRTTRMVGVFCATLCSFLYVIAQIYGVGLITSRLAGIDFDIAVFVGLGGVLVCSFVGGMRTVTWTQASQYIVLLVAYLVPVVWLSIIHTGSPVPQLSYGYTLQQLSAREDTLMNDDKEQSVREMLKQKAATAEAALKQPGQAYTEGKTALEKKVANLRAAQAPAPAIAAAEKALADYPASLDAAKAQWNRDQTLAARADLPRRLVEPIAGADDKARTSARVNFLTLILCLVLGTAALPHVLMRYSSTPSARDVRTSVAWSLLFISVFYVTAPALAVFVKYDIYQHLVGSSFANLPAWIASWGKVDPGLLSIQDVNGDGTVQLAEIALGQDIIVLATPEIAGLPYVISGLVAAGGLVAALSTVDGLLLTIANALSHDVYYKTVDPAASTQRRLTVAKLMLVVVAVLAATVAVQKPADILFLVGAAFSLGAAAFFPALVLGIFWKRATGVGALLGMLAGTGLTLYYMATTQPWLRGLFGVTTPIADATWFGIHPISAGIFGVPLGFAVIVVVSLVTPAPSQKIKDFFERARRPRLKADAT